MNKNHTPVSQSVIPSMINQPMIEHYKGHSILNIPLKNGEILELHLDEARAIIEHYKIIKNFVRSNEY